MQHSLRGGFDVYIREFGTGAEDALLLHCALAHSNSWKRVAALLADDLTMVAPDMLGHGQSAAPTPTSDLNDHIFAVSLACLPGHGHVIGHSFGATIALRLALTAPERVRSLTLIEPVLFAAARYSDPAAYQVYLATAQRFAQAMAQEDWRVAAEAFTRVWGDGRDWSSLSVEEQESLAEQMLFVRATEAPLMTDSAGLLKPDGLEEITCPTLFLRGARTEPVIAAIHATLKKRLPQAVEHVIDGAGHMAPITHPDPVARHIKTLLHTA